MCYCSEPCGHTKRVRCVWTNNVVRLSQCILRLRLWRPVACRRQHCISFKQYDFETIRHVFKPQRSEVCDVRNKMCSGWLILNIQFRNVPFIFVLIFFPSPFRWLTVCFLYSENASCVYWQFLSLSSMIVLLYIIVFLKNRRLFFFTGFRDLCLMLSYIAISLVIQKHISS